MTQPVGRTKIYYEDQAGWTTDDFYALWRYLSRLVQYIGPTAAQSLDPTSRAARIHAKKHGRRDHELAALDLSRMSGATLHLLKGVLVAQGRLDLALERFENLARLAEQPEVIDLDNPIAISDQPAGLDERLNAVGILL